jgi:hypothetical protein
MEQIQNDSDFVPIVLTLMVNGVAKNTAQSYYHNPDYYYDTAEYEMIERSEASEKAKKEAHEKNIAKHKAIRANLVQQITDKKSVVLLTAGKSSGVLNYNPKIDAQRKTSNVIGILAENFKELLNGIQNKFFSIEGGKTNPINTQGLRIVTAVASIEGNFIIYTQSNSSKSAFVSKVEYSVGTMLLDLVSPSGEVVTTSPFTKARFSYEQIKSLSELVLEKLQGRNTVDVGGTLVTISGTEKVPGILDSVMYVGKVKSSDADAINSQLYFTKDGRLMLGTKPYDKNTEGIYDIIEKHISQYKARPHFKFKSIEIFGNNFGIPVKQGNGTFKIENPVDYMEFIFGGKNPLIATALNPTKFVNSYFKFATNNDNTLKVEGETAKAEPITTVDKIEIVRSDKALSDNYENYEKEIEDMNSAIFDNLENADLLYKYYEIKELSIEDLDLSKKTKGYSKNDSDYLKDELKSVKDQKTPILINGRGEVVEGWHRVYSLKANNVKTIKAYVPIKENKAKPIIIPEPVSDIEAKTDIETEIKETLKNIKYANGTKIYDNSDVQYELEITQESKNVANALFKNEALNFEFLKVNQGAIFTTNNSNVIKVSINKETGNIELSEVGTVRYITIDKNNNISYDFENRGKEIKLEKARAISQAESKHQNKLKDVFKKYNTEFAALESKTEEIIEESSEEVIPTIINETVQNCKGVSAPEDVKITSESVNISKAADNYSWE